MVDLDGLEADRGPRRRRKVGQEGRRKGTKKDDGPWDMSVAQEGWKTKSVGCEDPKSVRGRRDGQGDLEEDGQKG